MKPRLSHYTFEWTAEHATHRAAKRALYLAAARHWTRLAVELGRVIRYGASVGIACTMDRARATRAKAYAREALACARAA